MPTREVNVDLYEFMKENETGLFKRNNDVIAYVHIYFFNLDDFVKIVGEDWFDEGGREVQMFNNTICIELNDVIEGDGHKLSSYEGCFDKCTWRDYKKEIEDMEGDS